MATTDSGKLVVVYSAYVQHTPQLRRHRSYYGAFVARTHRKGNAPLL